MGSSSPFVSRGRGSGSAAASTVKQWPVERNGFGIIFGDEHGGHPGEIFFEGAIIPLAPITGKYQTPVLTTRDGVHLLAEATIAADSATPVKLRIPGGMKSCIFRQVILREFSAAMPATAACRIYRQVANSSGVFPEPSAIIPATPIDGISGDGIKLITPYEQVSYPAFLMYEPRGALGPAGSTYKVQVWGMTEWFTNMPKPLVDPRP